MPFYKFKKNDVYINTLKTHPEIKYFIYNGTASYNNTPDISGSFTGSIRCTDPGRLSLFELNVDRVEGDNGYITIAYDGPLPGSGIWELGSVANTGLIYQFMRKDATKIAFSSVTSAKFSAGKLGEVFKGTYPYTARITKEFFPSGYRRYVAPVIEEPSPGSSGQAVVGRPGMNDPDAPVIVNLGYVSHLRALKNTINHYDYVSPHFSYSAPGVAASAVIRFLYFSYVGIGQTITLISTDGTSVEYEAAAAENTAANQFIYTGGQPTVLNSLKNCIEAISGHDGKILVSDPTVTNSGNYYIKVTQLVDGSAGNTTITEDLNYISADDGAFTGGAQAPGGISRDFDTSDVGLISIPTIFYGSRIKPGTMKLDFYFTGTLIGRLEDKNQNGVLYQTAPVGSRGLGSTAGIVLYSEGFIILTGSWDLSYDNPGTNKDGYTILGGSQAPSWTYFAQSISGSIIAPKSAFLIEMSGTSKIQNITMFATAPKGKINQSNNPTFINFVTGALGITSSTGYIQNENIGIKNIVSSSYNTPTGSFERTTYISKVGIYDKDMNLIAIAKPATPIKKTDARDFTFKMELDI